jgi:FlaA1/EpsC-like NDP-sugar epimerase
MSTNALRNILVIGATGAIGKPIFNQILLAKSSFDRVALLTSQNTVSSKAAELEALKKRGAEVLVGDLSNEDDVKKAYKGTSP